MRRVMISVLVVATSAASLAMSTGAARARTRSLAVLISIQGSIKHGVKWQVLGSKGKVLGSATDVCNNKSTVCRFDVKLAHGSIRMTWYLRTQHHTTILTRAPITGGSGQYAGARGSASVSAVEPGGTLSHNLTGADYLQVVFHLS